MRTRRAPRRLGGTVVLVLGCIGCVAMPAPLRSQAGEAASLPPAAAVVARYVDAIGGDAALAMHASMRLSGRFAMPALGLGGTIEILQARPNLMVSHLLVGGMGEIATGFDGLVGWAVNPMQGARLVSGRELDALRETADFDAVLRIGARVRSMRSVEQTSFGDHPCVRVDVVWQSGRESSDCYAVETGLLVATITRQESPMGSVEVTTLFDEYRDVGGLRVATRLRQRAMGQEQVITFSSVELDTVGRAAFALPAVIRALAAPPR